MKEPAPLPDDLLDYLAAEREPQVPSLATRERMFGRLVPFLPFGGPGGGGAGGPPPDATGGPSHPPATGTGSGASGATGAAGAGAIAGSAWKGKLVIAALSAAVGAGGGAAGHAMLAPVRPVPALVASPVAPVRSASMKVAEASAAAPAETAVAEAPEAPSARPAASARAEERVKASGSLRDERLLIETANAALLRGDHASAIASLRKHQRSFPKGELAQEREVLLVQALRASGDDRAAQERAKEFKRKFPNSLQQESVDKSSRP